MNIIRNIEPKSQKGYYFMRTDDIVGASPCQNKFVQQSLRRTNPLQPEYKLPLVDYSSRNNRSTNSSFIRDSLYVKDIEGTSAKPNSWIHTRNVNPYTEIEGSKTRQRRIFSKPNYQHNVKDINNDGVHMRTRSTNPLEPRYQIFEDKNYGYVDGCESLSIKPRIILKARQSNYNKDIELAYVNSAIDRKYFMETRRQLKNPIDVSDIEGTKAEQNKSKFITKRNLDPLEPKYQMPGIFE